MDLGRHSDSAMKYLDDLCIEPHYETSNIEGDKRTDPVFESGR